MAAAACGCRRVVARAALYPIWQRHGKVGLGKHLQARPGGRHCAALIRAAVRKSHGDGVHLAGDLVGPLRAAISSAWKKSILLLVPLAWGKSASLTSNDSRSATKGLRLMSTLVIAAM